jgi:hypothetical protein
MLTVMFRRLVLSGLLITGFVGTGVLFGQGPGVASTVESVGISLQDPASSVNSAEIGISLRTASPNANRQFAWPFFSFRKGGR